MPWGKLEFVGFNKYFCFREYKHKHFKSCNGKFYNNIFANPEQPIREYKDKNTKEEQDDNNKEENHDNFINYKPI